MPIKRASLQIPSGLEWVKDLKYFYAVGPTLIGKDFNSVDTTVSISFPPRGSIASLVEYGSVPNNYIEVQGASWVNPSDAANTPNMTTTAVAGNTQYSSFDYYYFNNFGDQKPYFESTEGPTAGNTYYVSHLGEIFEIQSTGVVRKLTSNMFSPGTILTNPTTISNFALTYSAQYSRIFFEDSSHFYIKALVNSSYQVNTGVSSNRVTTVVGKISKSTYEFERFYPSDHSVNEQLLIQLFESSESILFLQVWRNFGSYFEYNTTGQLQDSNFIVFNKTTREYSINPGAVSQDVTAVTSNKARYAAIGSTSYSEPKNINNINQSYFVYQNVTSLSLSIKSLELSSNLSSIKLSSNTFDCEISNAPSNLFNETMIPPIIGGSQTVPLLTTHFYSLSKFTESSFEYLVLHIYPRKTLPDGLTQKHIVFSINQENPRQLTYVTHHEVIGTYYNGVLPSPDGKSFLLVNDTSFLLLNWNGGSRSLVPSKVINTRSIIRRAAYDALNRIWINTSTDSDGNTLQDQLDIYYPTGTKYVRLSPKTDTTLEYLGTPLQPEFDVSVFDLTGNRLQQNVTLEVVGATFLGGASQITVQTSSSGDVTVKLNITAPGAIQIVATDF